MTHITRLKLATLIALVALLGMSAPALAEPLAPDLLQVKSALVVKNVKDPGDMFVAFHYVWAYNNVGNIPTQAARDVILFRLLSPDGSQELASNTPYCLGTPFKNGYQQGLSGFYFPPGHGLGEEAYIIRIVGNPAVFTSPPLKDYTLVDVDYYDSDIQADNQRTLGMYILDTMSKLETVFNTTLRGDVSQGIVLNALGEIYVRGAIRGVQSMAPTIFFVQFSAPSFAERDWEEEQATIYETRLEGEEGAEFLARMNKAGDFIGISGRMLFGLGLFGVVLFIAFRSQQNWRDTTPALIAGAAILTGGALAFGVPWAVWAIVGVISALILTWMLFLRYAG